MANTSLKNETLLKEIGLLIRWHRIRKGYSQRQIAEESGIRQATISGVENGTYNSNLTTIASVCNAVGCEFAILIDNENPLG